MTIKIGITGGIGSGKSTICNIFKLLGVPVFEADTIAKQLLDSDSKIKTKLIHLFGEGIYMDNGRVNRKKLANIIFNDNIQLEKMNKMVHPVVREKFNDWVDKQNHKYIIHEAAILFESGFYKMMDFNILVSAEKRHRIERVKKRDGVSEAQVLERISRQWTDKEKRKLASIEIINDNKRLIIPEIIEIDKKLKKYGKIW
ncbi:dephospho-CoA kinase [Maribellus maritimus]|uniref:dephospho-CoA kinase n=1 Tax=Maribellus maritimus TaxID=2870838 RepID=UPI001EEBC88E|nr:dephospho-CoA kinase [Maribellus maritimus]MCG6186895.1 dephospho-CoA kinase [Maribellus maritimus]